MESKKTVMKCSVKQCKNKIAFARNVSYFNHLKCLLILFIWINNCKTKNVIDPNSNKQCNYKVCFHHFETSI